MRVLLVVLLPFFFTFSASAKTEVATFGGGCFWCMEPPFEKLSGVLSAVSGYMGGQVENPTYKQVSGGGTGHLEVVHVTYDPSIIDYKDLLEVYWRQVDPTDPKGQFVDRGHQYSSAIFYHSEQQKVLAEKSRMRLSETGRFNKPIVTVIRKAEKFYAAEEYHQNYYKKPLYKYKYKYYRARSGRDDFIDKHWGQYRDYKPKKKESSSAKYTKPSDQKIKSMLTDLQYKVTQKDGTEKPFKNEFWNSKKDGIYVDIVTGEPLFSSTHKFKSGTGWPSFYQPLESDYVVEKEDKSWFQVRMEVRSKIGDSHLGHVFDDGPKPTGKRYCINSAALRFIPKEEMKAKGYEKYLKLFK